MIEYQVGKPGACTALCCCMGLRLSPEAPEADSARACHTPAACGRVEEPQQRSAQQTPGEDCSAQCASMSGGAAKRAWRLHGSASSQPLLLAGPRMGGMRSPCALYP